MLKHKKNLALLILSSAIYSSFLLFLSFNKNLNNSYEVKSSIAQSVIQQKSFPGAAGYGTYSVGGRGGRVIEVTNLNDMGAGSFREAVTSVGPRIVVFKVSGQIILNSPIRVKTPFLTIAAQTAPGGGILLRKDEFSIATHDVIVRNLRVRVGDEGAPSSDRDGINISSTYSTTDVYNIVLDHCSVAWGIDENVSTWIGATYKVYDVTVQNSIIAEGLYNSIHIDEGTTSAAPHSMGLLFATIGSGNLSAHHNLFAHNGGRNPRLDGVIRTEFVNNVVYNWSDIPTEIGSNTITAHIIGNYYKGGVNSSTRDIKFSDNQSTSSKIYVEGNYTNFGKDRTLDSTKARYPSTDQTASILQQTNGPISTWYSNLPPYFKSTIPLFDSGLKSTSASIAYSDVLQNAGAIPRDSVDVRIVSSVINRTGSRIDSQNQVGGWPILLAGTAPQDTDHDGIPDSWEQSYGLNPLIATDANTYSPNGYTWIEEYINSFFTPLTLPSITPTVTITIGSTNPVATPFPTLLPTNTPTLAPTIKPTIIPTIAIKDTTSPTISITSPQNGSTVSWKTNTIIKVSDSDNVKVTKIEFLVNNSLKCTNTSPSSTSSCTWKPPRTFSSVNYTIIVKAYDSSGNVGTASIMVKSQSKEHY